MRSDKIKVRNTGLGVNEALATAEAVAAYKKLPKKDALHLRLLTEEMMGMLQGLTGEAEAEFYIEDEDNVFKLHLVTETDMDSEKRRKLLNSSTSGRNAAVKGVMSKIRDLFQQAFEPVDGDTPSYYSAGWVGYEPEAMGIDFAIYENAWSFNRYRETVSEAKDEEEWDELEKSIVANLADEISIGIKKNRVEMVIYKKI